MGIDAEKTFTKHDKARNVENRVWCELVKLHTVNKEQSMKKFMDWEREVAEEKLRKHYPETLLRAG